MVFHYNSIDDKDDTYLFRLILYIIYLLLFLIFIMFYWFYTLVTFPLVDDRSIIKKKKLLWTIFSPQTRHLF